MVGETLGRFEGAAGIEITLHDQGLVDVGPMGVAREQRVRAVDAVGPGNGPAPAEGIVAENDRRLPRRGNRSQAVEQVGD